MIASIGNNGTKSLKPGAVLMVSGAKTETEAQTKLEAFLNTSKRNDLGYMSISKDYFLLYLK